jgi:superfamily II DNA or RNA helicase
MNSTISNKIVVENYSLALLDYCERNLVLPNPDYVNAKYMGRWVGNIEEKISLYERIGNRLVLPFGEIKNIWHLIKDNPYTLDFAPKFQLSMVGGINLYPYQENAINALKNAKYGILEAPCGSGKTQIGIGLIQALGQRALWLTHTKDLLNQSMERAKQYFDGDFGTITDGKIDIGRDITFATIQTMSKIDLQPYTKEWNVVIVDECHRVAGSPTRVMQFYNVLSQLKANHKYGLSATLDRIDGLIKTTFSLLGDIVHRIDEKEVGSKIMKAQHEVLFTGLHQSEAYLKSDGTLDYLKLIDYLTHNEDRNAQIATQIYKEPNHHHLVLTHRVEHIKRLHDILYSIGVHSEMIYGSLTNIKREDILNQMREGHSKVLISTYALAKEGLDIPILDRLHLASPNKNKAIIKQSAGRIERNIDGKQDAIVYDYVDENIGYCMGMYKKRKAILK